MHRSNLGRLFVLAALTLAATGALAQGVTGSAVTGTVRKEDQTPLEGVQIQLRNPATGDSFSAVSGKSGQYTIDNVPTGGPYVLTATAEGYQPATQPDIQLALGQRVTVDLLRTKPSGRRSRWWPTSIRSGTRNAPGRGRS